ncbi:MAG: hypothetical protein ACO36E_03240 [Synechocystis sp.]
MKGFVLRGSLLGIGLVAIAIVGGSNLPQAFAQMIPDANPEDTLTPLPPSEGTARDLAGTFAKDSALWLGGVGGDGDIEATDSDENPYEIRSRHATPTVIQSPHRETPAQQRIQLGQF